MPIDPNIAMGYRPPQIEMPDVQNARAAQVRAAEQQAMLGQMQMTELARANQQKNKMRDILSKAPEGAPSGEINKLLEQAYIQSGDISGLMTHRKALAEAEAAQANVGKAKAQTKQAEATTALSEFELSKKRLDHGWESIGNSRNPTEYRANIFDALSKKLITQEQADTGLAQLEQVEIQDRMTGGNQNFNKFRLSNLEKLLSAKDQLSRIEPKPEKVDTGRTLDFIDLNPNSPTYGQKIGPKSITKTQTFAEEETARHNKKTEGIQGAELKLKQEKELREKDPAFQQAMAGAKARGEAIAKGDVAAVQALPKILDRANRSLTLIDEMVGKQEVRDKNGKIIQAATAPHPGFNSAVGFGLGERFMPGTSASDFQSRFEEIKGGAFLEAFESLKGAGSISEKEGEKATTAITRMSLAQSEKEFVAAARDLQDVVRKATVNAQNRASQAGATPNVDALIDKYKTK
jgi:hypothetical protein